MADPKTNGPDPAWLWRQADEVLREAEEREQYGPIPQGMKDRVDVKVARATPWLEVESREELRRRRDALQVGEGPMRDLL